MADSDSQKDDKTINLQNAQINEANSAGDDNLLASEEALLGIGAGSKGDDSSGSTTATKQSGQTKFHIPTAVKEDYPGLIPLILKTESMDDEEREYWFQILPIMTDEQVLKLKEILVNEKDQLAKLDADYEVELNKINEKHLNEWQAFEYEQERKEIKTQEAAHEVSETSLEEDLLDKLDEL